MEIKKKKSGWGGARKNAGRKPRKDLTPKKVVSIYVTESVWKSALAKSGEKGSRLVEGLLREYTGAQA